MDNDALIKSKLLENHAIVVMELIDKTIIGIDDYETTHQRLLILGMEHKARNIKPDLIDQIRVPFLLAVEQTLDSRFSDRMRPIYETFIDYLLSAIKDGYNC